MSDRPNDQFLDKGDWSLSQWLRYLEAIHPVGIDMGLDRVSAVFARLDLDFSHSRIITVAGTNGKGTTCAVLAQAGMCRGLSVGVYSSPHLIDYRERVTLNTQMLSEQAHCDAFYRVDQARGNISLTYFEFGTLAALCLLADAAPDWILLEVGLGGRLDAVNIVDPELAIITSIGIDHIDWLGDNREDIGFEKAGIMRAEVDTVIGDSQPPNSVLSAARKVNSQVYIQGQDFAFERQCSSWNWQSGKQVLKGLPVPSVPVVNVSTAFKALQQLGITLSVSEACQIVGNTRVVGRMQKIHDNPDVLLDVAHNPQASTLLAKQLIRLHYRKCFMVVGMLSDKDIPATLKPLFELPAIWLPATLDVPRGACCATLAGHLVGQHIEGHFDSVVAAYQRALQLATPNDVIVVFGSFFTVAEVLQSVENK